MRQNGLHYGVAQGFLQPGVALANGFRNDSAHKIIVHDLFNLIVQRGGLGQRNVQINIEDDALRRLAFEIMDANANLPRQSAYENSSAML